jgi:hypothetical protein
LEEAAATGDPTAATARRNAAKTPRREETLRSINVIAPI